jgi:hypothetical protein
LGIRYPHASEILKNGWPSDFHLRRELIAAAGNHDRWNGNL